MSDPGWPEIRIAWQIAVGEACGARASKAAQTEPARAVAKLEPDANSTPLSLAATGRLRPGARKPLAMTGPHAVPESASPVSAAEATGNTLGCLSSG